MSNTLKLQVLLEAVDRATRPFNAVRKETEKLSADIQETQDRLDELNAKSAQIEGFRETRKELTLTQQNLKNTRAEAAALAIQLKNTQNPTAEQTQALDKLRQSANALQQKNLQLRQSVQEQRQSLNEAGISTRRLSSERQKLNQQTERTTSTLNAQGESMNLLNQRQDKLNRTRERYRAGMALADNVQSASSKAKDFVEKGRKVIDYLSPSDAKDGKGRVDGQGAGNITELNKAMASVGPVAKQAGLSVGQTAAMMGVLAENGITGSQAGAGASAMLTHVQAPDASADSALKALNVQTADDQGNSQPIFAVLSQVQAAFEKNKLDAAQQATYLQAIFGQQGAAPAAALMKGAASGRLDQLSQAPAAQPPAADASVDTHLQAISQDGLSVQSVLTGVMNINPQLSDSLLTLAAGGLTLVDSLASVGNIAWPVISGLSTIMAGVELLGGAFAIIGGAITATLGAITLPVVVLGAAIAAGAMLVYQYWEPISAFISGIAQGFSAAMGPISDAFAPLKPVFEWFSNKVSELGAWFSKLLEPVKFSQQELASAGEMGQRFGNMLATALKLPGEALNQLRGGIDWVLGKLGIIDEKSDKVKDKLPPPKMREQDEEDEDNADARPAASRASLNSTLNQPLPSVNNSNVDNRQHTVTNNIFTTSEPQAIGQAVAQASTVSPWSTSDHSYNSMFSLD
ncbi:TP901 family phage tail tape measure protein [Pantoea sp. PA1]|uniref:phage tail tape measure protein n=1 Tax=Pantoea ananas TaxID=553 RepID=UPI00091388D5|nr:phage tail tape measure protein [Pantoea ananatis]MDH0055898.1 phage tail tape measure protein [Pantoea ananatis]MDJ0031461.1 phage tail tape measure protein [Pantoea ananatis]MDJ0046897.1 phage tail tape measure protein [Pantoea ananatis]SFX89702.1 phage tail tape measure protein, TP901 family, core region [Pantoea ananatis]